RLLLDDWGGLGTRHPAAALAMTIFLLSLGGIPPTAGFFGKFYIFKAALESSALLPLVVIAVLNSVISIYYYLKVVMVMYFREAGRETVPLRSAPVTLALVVAAFFVLQMGLQPGRYLAYAAKSLLVGSASRVRLDPARVPIDPGPRRLTPVFSEPSRRPSLAHGVLPMPCWYASGSGCRRQAGHPARPAGGADRPGLRGGGGRGWRRRARQAARGRIRFGGDRSADAARGRVRRAAGRARASARAAGGGADRPRLDPRLRGRVAGRRRQLPDQAFPRGPAGAGGARGPGPARGRRRGPRRQRKQASAQPHRRRHKRHPDRELPAPAGGHRSGGAGGRHRRHGPHHRRKRDRQGSGRAAPARGLTALRRAAG